WSLPVGAGWGDGNHRGAGAVTARAGAALGPCYGTGAAGETRPVSAPVGEGQCRAGDPGDGRAPVAGGRGGGAGRRRGPGGGRQEWDSARGGLRERPTGQLWLRP